jgi:hypothetical protein
MTKKVDNFEELALVTNNGNIEFVERTYNLKSYLLCHCVCDLSITGKVINCYRHALIRCIT